MKLKRVASFISVEILENLQYSQQRHAWSGPLQKEAVSLLQTEFLPNQLMDKAARQWKFSQLAHEPMSGVPSFCWKPLNM